MKAKATKTLAERVRTLVEKLGDTPAKIAATLRRRGTKGRRGECSHCPIATEIIRRFPELDVVEVSGHDINIEYICGQEWDEATIHFGPDSACCKFVSDFDDGKLPDLEEPREYDH